MFSREEFQFICLKILQCIQCVAWKEQTKKQTSKAKEGYLSELRNKFLELVSSV